MRFIKYFTVKWIIILYPVAALCLATGVSFLVKGDISIGIEIAGQLTALLLFVRCCDDFFDFEKDKGRKTIYLEKTQLKILAVIFAVAFVMFNVLVYGIIGLFSILFVFYVGLWERFLWLKKAFATFLYVYYCVSNGACLRSYIMGILIFFSVSCAYGFYKMRCKK